MSTTIGNLAVMVSANSAGFTAGFATMSNSLGGFVSSLGKLGAMVGITAGIGEGLKTAFGGAADMESSQVAFETLLGSADKAKTLMGDLAKFGAETPFQLPELTKAGKSLAAFGMSADEIVPKLRRIGDISSLLNQPIGEMATLYGKAKVAGVLMSEDINQFTERGVPLIQALATKFGVAEVQVKKLASEGKISFNDLDQAIASMTENGGRFAGGMAKQAGTLGGLWSTLTDNIGMSITNLGQTFITAFSGKDAINGLIGFTGTIQSTIAGWSESVSGIVPYIQTAFSTLGSIISTVWEGISLGGQAVFGNLGLIFGDMGESIGSFKDLFVDAMLNVRFVFENFGAYWELGWEQMKLTMVVVSNDIVHLFTVNVPEVLGWFSRQWRNVFTDVYNLTTTIFENIGKNIWEFFKNIPGLIAGTTSLADIWTPLTDGFKTSITEALSVTKRDLTDWEQQQLVRVGELEGKISQKRETFMDAEKAKLAESFSKLETAGIATTGATGAMPATAAMAAVSAAGKDSEKKYSSALEYGSKEAYNVILRSREFTGPAQRTAKAVEKTAVNSDRTIEKLDELITAVEDFGGGIAAADLDGGFGTN